ncbi:MAG: NifB/NifX family molybdenum-iron cluster-binding protein [Candidatus Riflebacteria bacterium]|jgi:predicted Fe-Mo cluster-binding NifX family protein|nr:NifB/NifX family molybdenum-iron cluster-binding protein [Candidatus Riflebacteria bacterium]
MKIAIPVTEGTLCTHFGHCQQFCILTVNESKQITNKEMLTPPPHEPGVLPRWLAEQKATVILAGGMGHRAQELFSQNGIQVITGVQGGQTPETAAEAYLKGTLQTGENACSH